MRQAKIDQTQGYEETIEPLRRAEQRYRSIFENATEEIFQTTPEGKYLSVNPALARMYGYDSPGELLADLTDSSRQLYVQPDRRHKFTLAMRHDGHIEDFESQIRRHDGSIIWISENARAVHDEVTGELLYYEGMVQDITRRKSAEEARRRAEENLVGYAEELRVKNAQSVGGDFFCVLPLSNNEAGVFICDVVGHGLRAAVVTAIMRGLVEELASVANNPGRFVTQINHGLRAIFRQTEMPMLASAIYLVANIDNGKMAYTNAGHPPLFHVRRGAGLVEVLGFDEGHGPVLGIFEDAECCTGYCATAAQDLVVLFTDGLFEVEIANGEYYGQERLLAAVRDRMRLPVGELFHEVLAEVQERCAAREFSDDVCLVGMEVMRTGLADTGRRVD
jgi:PAS domain S-box-containing protein